MFTVQKKRRVLVVSDLEWRNTGAGANTEAILTGDVADLSKALSTFVSATLWKWNQKWELQIWANMTIGQLSEDTKQLIASIIKKSETGEIIWWGWGGQQDADIQNAISSYLPK